MSLSRLFVRNGQPFKFRLTWKTALIGVPFGFAGIAAIIYYVHVHRNKKSIAIATSSPLEESLALKLKGNKYFKCGNYAKAIEAYNLGLEKCPDDAVQERAAFYQNRAAAEENLHQYESALSDCNSALELQPKYLKALSRRANVYEKLERLEESLLDIAACCLFEKYKNPDSIVRMDMVLNKIAKKKASSEHSQLVHQLPSPSSIRNYFCAFAWNPFVIDFEFSEPLSKSVISADSGSESEFSHSNCSSKISNGDEKTKSGMLDVSLLKEPAPSAYRELLNALNALSSEDFETSMNCSSKAHSLFKKLITENDESVFDSVKTNSISKTNGDVSASNTDDSGEFPLNSDESDPERVSAAAVTTTVESTIIDQYKAHIKTSYNKTVLLHATYLMLMGRSSEAKEMFQSIAMDDSGATAQIRVNALIKSACLSMSLDEDIAACLYDFQRAELCCPECPDVYLQRGQINLLADQLDEALHDLNKAVKLKPEFSVAQAQRLYILYRSALRSLDMDKANCRVEEFRKLLKNYPNCLETHSLFSQILTERGDLEESDALFADLIKIAPDSGMAYAYRGLLQLRWKQDRVATQDYLLQGVKADPKCQLIHELLGQMAVEQGHFEAALEHFNNAIRLGKTEREIVHLIALREGVRAQLAICLKYDEPVESVVNAIQLEQKRLFSAM